MSDSLPRIHSMSSPMPVNPRRVVFLRHGVTEHNARGRWQGHLDTSLTEAGREQARAAAPSLALYEPQVIVSSDLARAAETADILAAECGLVAMRDARFREIHIGSWQGLDAAGVEAAFPGAQARLAAGEDLRRGGSGERVADVVARGRPALDEILADVGEGRTALVVTHGVCARSLVADLAGIDQKTAWLSLTGLGNCHWAEVAQSSATRWRLALWNGRATPLGRHVREAHGY